MKRIINRNRIGLILGGILLLSAGFVGGKMMADISPENIANAEILIGLEFSPVERDSMNRNLTNYRTSYETMRKQPITNSVAPAIGFNPLPHGFVVMPP